MKSNPKRKSDPKLAALEESGTSNPRPEGVADPTFVGSDFFDARDLIQVKYEMLRRARTDGMAIADSARLFGMSRPTFYKAQSAFEHSGLSGLLPAKRGPHGAHKVTDEVLRFIEEVRSMDVEPAISTLVERIRQRFGIVVHRRTVERALARSKKKRQ